jgi:hypothetical protein
VRLSEAETHWRKFLERLVVSDDHAGLSPPPSSPRSAMIRKPNVPT